MVRSTRRNADDGKLADLLDTYTTLLIEGNDANGYLASQAPLPPPADGLAGLARRLHETLVPVEPGEEFVAALRVRLERLQARRERAARRWALWRQRLAKLPTRPGTILSIVALVALAARIVGSLIMLIFIVTGHRRRRAAPV